MKTYLITLMLAALFMSFYSCKTSDSILRPTKRGKVLADVDKNKDKNNCDPSQLKDYPQFCLEKNGKYIKVKIASDSLDKEFKYACNCEDTSATAADAKIKRRWIVGARRAHNVHRAE